MHFVPTAIEGAYFIEMAPHVDHRGTFSRVYCRDALRRIGVAFDPVQCNLSSNPAEGTLRGLHYQLPPHQEAKLVLCVSGSVFDVAVDLRRSSASFGKAVGTTLAERGPRLFYIPEGCAHGFLTLEADSTIFYFVGAAFEPAAGAGIRWNDPAFDIVWPGMPKVISERDAHYPDFDADTDGLP